MWWFLTRRLAGGEMIGAGSARPSGKPLTNRRPFLNRITRLADFPNVG
jgi:hypothetical protein